ncbi:MAG: plasmid recombination protein, partial [Cryomorphaceae bacterium]
WDQAKLDEWIETTMTWLRKEYGDDLTHVSLHLDETTPHLHVLIVPTYERKNRKPSRRKKSGETIEEFQERLTDWENNPEITRTAGRSSSEYWSKVHCRTDARRSYHAAVEHLGLGYGRDFVAERSPSPTNKVTGTWVREEAARLADERIQLDRDRVAIATDREAMIEDAKISVGRIRSRATEIIMATKKAAKEIRDEVEIEKAQLSEDQAKLHQDRADFEVERASLHDEVRSLRDQLKGALKTVIRWIKGKELSDEMAAEGTQLVRDHHRLVSPPSPPEESPENAGPGV